MLPAYLGHHRLAPLGSKQGEVGGKILITGDALTAHFHIVLGRLAVPFTGQAQVLHGIVWHPRGTCGKAAQQSHRTEGVFADFLRLFLTKEVLHAAHDGG